MNILKRENDLISGKNDLEKLYSLNNFPIHMGCTKLPKEIDIFCDLNFCISKSSGLIQISDLIPLDVLYSSSHYSGSVGGIWQDHHLELAELISKYKARNIFEIGGQHDNLFNEYSKLNQDFKWTIIDPGTVKGINSKINVINSFFDENTIIDKEVDCLVHSHFFEHLYDPMSFIKSISSQLDNRLMIFSIPNLGVWMKKNYSNVIHFEHTFLLTENYVEYMLNLNQLQVIEKKYFAQDHSIFYVISKNMLSSEPILLENYEAQKNNFMNYISERKNIINDINNKLKDKKNIYIFGAHVNTQMSLWMGLNKDNVIGILDNNKNKQDQRLYGTDFKVFDPNIIANQKDISIIVDAGKYTDEICSSLYSKNNQVNLIY